MAFLKLPELSFKDLEPKRLKAEIRRLNNWCAQAPESQLFSPWLEHLEFMANRNWPFSSTYHNFNRQNVEYSFDDSFNKNLNKPKPVTKKDWEILREQTHYFWQDSKWTKSFGSLSDIETYIKQCINSPRSSEPLFKFKKTVTSGAKILSLVRFSTKEISDFVNSYEELKGVRVEFGSENAYIPCLMKGGHAVVVLKKEDEKRFDSLLAHEWFPGHGFQQVYLKAPLSYYNPFYAEGYPVFCQYFFSTTSYAQKRRALLLMEALIHLRFINGKIDVVQLFKYYQTRRDLTPRNKYVRLNNFYISPIYGLRYSLGLVVVQKLYEALDNNLTELDKLNQINTFFTK
ncbi:MAG: hypothetical protein DRR19_17950 [Candidatus Parabeggiatoa sp. nov. 1]|nr:MAG: hypothetical protein DRR19_17950 [Gammaproteobacteria bacterium]